MRVWCADGAAWCRLVAGVWVCSWACVLQLLLQLLLLLLLLLPPPPLFLFLLFFNTLDLFSLSFPALGTGYFITACAFAIFFRHLSHTQTLSFFLTLPLYLKLLFFSFLLSFPVFLWLVAPFLFLFLSFSRLYSGSFRCVLSPSTSFSPKFLSPPSPALWCNLSVSGLVPCSPLRQENRILATFPLHPPSSIIPPFPPLHPSASSTLHVPTLHLPAHKTPSFLPPKKRP